MRKDSILREVALPGKIQSRCDGAGSAADGTKPTVKPGPYVPVLGVLVFWHKLQWWSLGAEALDRSNAKWPGRFCPAFLGPCASPSREIPRAWHRSLAPPARWSVTSSDRSSSSTRYFGRLGSRSCLGRLQGRHFGSPVTVRNAEILITESYG